MVWLASCGVLYRDIYQRYRIFHRKYFRRYLRGNFARSQILSQNSSRIFAIWGVPSAPPYIFQSLFHFRPDPDVAEKKIDPRLFLWVQRAKAHLDKKSGPIVLYGCIAVRVRLRNCRVLPLHAHFNHFIGDLRRPLLVVHTMDIRIMKTR